MKEKDNKVIVTTNDKLVAFIVCTFTSILGGFILGEYHRRKGSVEKAEKLKLYMYLGVLMGIILFFAAISLSNNQESGHSSRNIESILPKIEDYTNNVEFETPDNNLD